MRTVRELFRYLSELPDDKMADAEAQFAAAVEERRKQFEKLKEAPAWKTLDYRAARSGGMDFKPGRYSYVGPFHIRELAHLAEQIACDEADSYQIGMTNFYEGR